MAALMAELTPPPVRSPVRFAAVAAIGLVLIGGATAAVVARPDAPPPPVKDSAKELVEKINKLEDERRQLLKVIADDKAKLSDYEVVKKKLEDKEEEIHDLVDQVTLLRQQQQQARPMVRPPADKQITASIQGAYGNVEGCFLEWEDRADVFGSNGKPELVRDANLLVELSVAPDGHAYNQKARGIDSVSLQLCVADALARLAYPRGPDHSDLQVQVLWTGRVLTMTGSIVSHRPPSSSNLEGI
jgi:hypothetical protein